MLQSFVEKKNGSGEPKSGHQVNVRLKRKRLLLERLFQDDVKFRAQRLNSRCWHQSVEELGSRAHFTSTSLRNIRVHVGTSKHEDEADWDHKRKSGKEDLTLPERGVFLSLNRQQTES